MLTLQASLSPFHFQRSLFCRNDRICTTSTALRDTSRAQFGVYFTQQQDVFTSYSSWLLTITVDLSPYDNQMSMIANKLQAFKASLDTLRNISLSMDEIDETRILQGKKVQFIIDLHKLFTHEFEYCHDCDVTHAYVSSINDKYQSPNIPSTFVDRPSLESQLK